MAFEDGGVRSLTCLDCNASAKFISPDGEAYFKLMHAGHRIVEGGRTGAFSAPEGGGEGSDASRSSARRDGSFESMFGESAEPSSTLPAEADSGEGGAGDQEGRPGKGRKGKPKRAGSPPPAGTGSHPEGSPQMVGHGDLLLARTSFIENTEEAELETVRVSKALAKLRWNITPPYTVSMVFSDILCITSDSASIGKELVDLVEALGYDFSGFEANNSRPLAWFKKREQQVVQEVEVPERTEEQAPPPEPQAPPAPDAAKLDELAQAIRDQGTQIEKEMERIDEERRAVAERLKTLSPEGEQGQA